LARASDGYEGKKTNDKFFHFRFPVNRIAAPDFPWEQGFSSIT
jgi:hypothetical protein